MTSSPGRVRRELDAVDLVPVALVVDQRARAELPDRQEPGPLHVVAVGAQPPVGRDVGGDRQPGERVAGQEPLGGEVAVGVEVGGEVAVVAVLVAQQAQLGLGLVAAAAGDVAVPLGQRVVEAAAVLLPLVDQRRAEQVAPPVEGPVERRRGGADDALDPARVPPGGPGRAGPSVELVQHGRSPA